MSAQPLPRDPTATVAYDRPSAPGRPRARSGLRLLEGAAENSVHVIVQAGGLGSRLKHLTSNKPKCLLSVGGKPLLYHLFDRFAAADFLVLADYKADVLEKYLRYNRPASRYQVVHAEGRGTASGVRAALAKVPPTEPVLLVWSDLFLNRSDLDFDRLTELPEDRVTVFVSDELPCRWSVQGGRLAEVPSQSDGVVGAFFAPRAELLQSVPAEGELVRWLAGSDIALAFHEVRGLREFGTLDSLERTGSNVSRFFNDVEMREEVVVKRPLVADYEHLIASEIEWYRRATELGIDCVPALLSAQPLTLERIRGRHPFDGRLDHRQKERVLQSVLSGLDQLHQAGSAPWRPADIQSVYVDKTIDRVLSVKDLIPHYDREAIVINGRICRNLFHPRHYRLLAEIEHRCLGADTAPREFRFVHGDPTFSNTLVDDQDRAWFIDPRGTFGSTRFYGDADYDFAKLYYSVAGSYDAFNQRRFMLKVDESSVAINVEPSGYEHLGPLVAERGSEPGRIELLHGLIWLALAGYTRDDYDSILGAFYRGLYLIEEWFERP